MKAPKKPGRSRQKPAAAPSVAPLQVPTEEEIRQRAYAIYLARGGTHGRHRDDWEQAERELRAEYRAR